jgi:trehalose 6-phosphate phosphatase
VRPSWPAAFDTAVPVWNHDAMDFVSTRGEQQYAALVRAADDVAVGLDFDGTLAPIVDHPEDAYIHTGAPEVLVALAGQVRAVAVVTGRPAQQVLDLGVLEEVGRAIGEGGRELFVLGQYGNERWTSSSRRVVSPEPPPGLGAFAAELPRLLSRADAAEAWIEEKGLAVAVHTRRLEDPQAAYDRLLPVLSEAATSHDLDVEPGRAVIEVRAHGMHKGAAVHQLVEELGLRGMVFCGDDLGDVEAFKAVEELRGQGLPGLLVCSASAEQTALTDLADVVVEGPGGVLGMLRELTGDIERSRS